MELPLPVWKTLLPVAREQEEGDKVCKTEIGVYGMWRERERPFKRQIGLMAEGQYIH